MTNIKNRYISMLGLPGSGKGTQAEVLSKAINAKVLSIGELVRKEINNKKVDESIVNKYNRGEPQDDSFIKAIVNNEIKKLNNKIIIFDNYPFSEAQVLGYKNMINNSNSLLIIIQISPETALKRISHRLICPQCRENYIDYKSSDYCEKCGTKLIERSDDKEKIVKQRISEYIPRINKIIEEFEDFGEVCEINGENTPKEVAKDIFKKVKTWIY